MLSRYARWLSLAGWLGLVAGLLGWHGWMVGAILALPLLAAAPGLWRGRRYTYGWTSLLVMAYLAYLLTEFIAGGQPLAVAPALVAAAALFCGCLLYVRLRARELTATAASPRSPRP